MILRWQYLVMYLCVWLFLYLSICVWKTVWGFVCFCYPVGWEFETWVSSSMVRALPTRRRVIPWWPHVRLPGTGRCRRRPLFENLIICQTLPSLRLIIWCNSQLQSILLFEVFFIGHRSDHSLPMSLFTNKLFENWMSWPRYADYADYAEYAYYAD